MKELTRENKINWLKKNINWADYEEIRALGFSEEKLEQIYDFINDDSGYPGDISIVDEAQGVSNNEEGWELWIKQTHHGEDWYSGFCYLKLAEKKYLSWSYEG